MQAYERIIISIVGGGGLLFFGLLLLYLRKSQTGAKKDVLGRRI